MRRGEDWLGRWRVFRLSGISRGFRRRKTKGDGGEKRLRENQRVFQVVAIWVLLMAAKAVMGRKEEEGGSSWFRPEKRRRGWREREVRPSGGVRRGFTGGREK
ncbi:hypothetical protein HAX54_049963, partial [Datura stramonium]|nr:hypothetical protein [Datura stramonium]